MPKKKPTLFERVFCNVKLIETFGNNPQYIAVSIPVTKDELSMIRNKRLMHLEKKAKKLLLKAGTKTLLYSEECRLALAENKSINVEFPKSSDIPLHQLCDCFFKFFSPVSRLYQSKRLVIKDSNLNFTNIEVIERLCKAIKYISVFCKSPKIGEIISNEIFKKYGLWVDFYATDTYAQASPPFLLIDADKHIVRVGDRIICGAEFVSKSMDYNLNPAEEAYILGSENNMDVSAYF